jgi:hypothetical protein
LPGSTKEKSSPYQNSIRVNKVRWSIGSNKNEGRSPKVWKRILVEDLILPSLSPLCRFNLALQLSQPSFWRANPSLCRLEMNMGERTPDTEEVSRKVSRASGRVLSLNRFPTAAPCGRVETRQLSYLYSTMTYMGLRRLLEGGFANKKDIGKAGVADITRWA